MYKKRTFLNTIVSVLQILQRLTRELLDWFKGNAVSLDGPVDNITRIMVTVKSTW